MALRRSIVTAKATRQLAAPRVTASDPSVQRALDSLTLELTPVVSSLVLQGRIFDVTLAIGANLIEHGIGRVPQFCTITPIDATGAAQVAWLRDDDTDTILAIDSTATATVRLWVF